MKVLKKKFPSDAQRLVSPSIPTTRVEVDGRRAERPRGTHWYLLPHASLGKVWFHPAANLPYDRLCWLTLVRPLACVQLVPNGAEKREERSAKTINHPQVFNFKNQLEESPFQVIEDLTFQMRKVKMCPPHLFFYSSCIMLERYKNSSL